MLSLRPYGEFRVFRKLPILAFLFLMAFLACRKGEIKDGDLPDTRLFLDQIQLPDSSRLITRVELHWFGSVRNGYITGYEVSSDGGASWGLTVRTDSTFVFPIPTGNQNTIINFQVRSIDQLGRRDASPAVLNIPIQNTPPTLILRDSIKDTVFTVLSFAIQAGDPDGVETLDSILIRCNGSDWIAIPASTEIITIVPDNPQQIGAGSAKILRGTTASLWPVRLPSLLVGGQNQIEIQARDQSSALSPIVQSVSFYLREISSDLLLIDAFSSGADARQTYTQAIQSVYSSGFDLLPLYDSNRKYFPAYWNPAFSQLINLYDKVIWYSNKSAYNGTDQASGLVLETATSHLQNWLNTGGKLCVIQSLPAIDTNNYFSFSSPVFNLLPADSISTSIGQARIQTDSLIVPISGNYPTLTASAFLVQVSPFWPKPGAEPLYQAKLSSVGGWTGPNYVAARTRWINGKPQLIYFSLDMYLLNQQNNLQQFFNEVLNQEFNW